MTTDLRTQTRDLFTEVDASQEYYRPTLSIPVGTVTVTLLTLLISRYSHTASRCLQECPTPWRT